MWRSQQIDSINESQLQKAVEMIMDSEDRQSSKLWFNIEVLVYGIVGYHAWQSVAEESGYPISHVAQELIEFFLSVEAIVLAQGGIVVAEVFEDLFVESLASWRNDIDACSKSTKDIGESNHYVTDRLLNLMALDE